MKLKYRLRRSQVKITDFNMNKQENNISVSIFDAYAINDCLSMSVG